VEFGHLAVVEVPLVAASTLPTLDPARPAAMAVEAFQLPPLPAVLHLQGEAELEASSDLRLFLHLRPVPQVKLATATLLEQASLWEKWAALVILWACRAVGLAQVVVFQLVKWVPLAAMAARQQRCHQPLQRQMSQGQTFRSTAALRSPAHLLSPQFQQTSLPMWVARLAIAP